MLGIHVPVTADQLAGRSVLEIAHDYLGLTQCGLEPGQLLIIRSLDDEHRCVEVVSLHFTPTRTIYRLALGSLAIDDTIVQALVSHWIRPLWFTNETVLDLLGDCGSLLATTGAA